MQSNIWKKKIGTFWAGLGISIYSVLMMLFGKDIIIHAHGVHFVLIAFLWYIGFAILLQGVDHKRYIKKEEKNVETKTD